MSCHGCAATFDASSKQNKCPGCDFEYCSKCLSHKRVMPQLGPGVKTVCMFCFVGTSDENETYFLDRLQKLEILENPAKPPITVYKHDTKMEQLKSGLSSKDNIIVQRLEKLREDRKKGIVSEEQIRHRLAALKGTSVDIEGGAGGQKSSISLVSDKRTAEEKTNDLLKQLMDEYVLSLKDTSPEEMIAKRLAKLRRDRSSSTGVCSEEASAKDKTEKNEELSQESSGAHISSESLKNVSRHSVTDDDIVNILASAGGPPVDTDSDLDSLTASQREEYDNIFKELMKKSADSQHDISN